MSLQQQHNTTATITVRQRFVAFTKGEEHPPGRPQHSGQGALGTWELQDSHGASLGDKDPAARLLMDPCDGILEKRAPIQVHQDAGSPRSVRGGAVEPRPLREPGPRGALQEETTRQGEAQQDEREKQDPGNGSPSKPTSAPLWITTRSR